MSEGFSPVVLAKLVLWVGAVVAATLLLRRSRASGRVRIVFLVAGILLFGFLFGLLARGGLDPNPVFSLRQLLRLVFSSQRSVLVAIRQPATITIAVMLLVLLATVWISNKSICGWGCQFGLLQDLLYRVRLPKWKPPFWLTNSIRLMAFAALVGGLMVTKQDWIGWVDPFQLFRFNFTLAIGSFAVLLLVASLFVYRPWCQLLCPFGFAGWLVEQVSILRPRINWAQCKKCQLCVNACPTQAMADFYAKKKTHADCFACGACIKACRRKDALDWKGK